MRFHKFFITTGLLAAGCLSIQNALAQSSSTTVLFEVPSTQFDTNKNFRLQEIFPGMDHRGSKRGSFPGNPCWTDETCQLDPNRSTYYDFNPPVKQYTRRFSTNTPINQYFVNNIANVKAGIEQQMRSLMINSPRVTSIQKFELDQRDMRIILGVNRNRIEATIKGVSIDTRARVKTKTALEKVLCGSSVTAEMKASVEMRGEYNLGAGTVSITGIDPTVRVDVECSGIVGKLFDPLYELAAGILVDSMVDDTIEPLIETYAVGDSLNNLIRGEAQRAASRLGFNIVDDAWRGINRYLDGLHLEFRLGVDHYGKNQHLLGFAAYQAPPSARIIYNRGSRNRLSVTSDYVCPSWATGMHTLKTHHVSVGKKRKGRHNVDVWGVNFDPHSTSGTSWQHLLYNHRGPSPNNDPKPGVTLAACRSANGLTSYYQALGYKSQPN